MARLTITARPTMKIFLSAEFLEAELERAIEHGDKEAIVKYLQELKYPLPVEIANQLGKYLDPTRPPMKRGQKTYPTVQNAAEYSALRYSVVGFYRCLCRNPELALALMRYEAFEFTESYWKNGPIDMDGRLRQPIDWQHPHKSRDREEELKKRRGRRGRKSGDSDFKNLVCEMHGITPRTKRWGFDDLHAAASKDIAHGITFFRERHPDWSEDKLEAHASRGFDIHPLELNRIISRIIV